MDTISDSELFDSRYNIFPRDRRIDDITMGGGVLLAVKRELDAICNCSWRSTDEIIFLPFASSVQFDSLALIFGVPTYV